MLARGFSLFHIEELTHFAKPFLVFHGWDQHPYHGPQEEVHAAIPDPDEDGHYWMGIAALEVMDETPLIQVLFKPSTHKETALIFLQKLTQWLAEEDIYETLQEDLLRELTAKGEHEKDADAVQDR